MPILRRCSGHWLAVAMITVAAQPFLRFLVDSPGGERLSASATVFWFGMVVSAVLAAFSAPGRDYPVPVRAALIAFLIASLGALVSVWEYAGPVFSYAIWLPVVLALTLSKRPSRQDAMRAADVFAVTVTVGFAGLLIVEMLGIVAFPQPMGTTVEYEEAHYWLPLSEMLGVPGRWFGPFLHPNLAAPLSAALVVFGLGRPRRLGVPLVAANIVVLLLASSRTSWVAAVAGCLVLLAVALDRSRRLSRWAWLALGVPAAALALLLLSSNPTMTGRTGVWPAFLDLANEAPLLGVGDKGIGLAIQGGLLPAWAAHAHNVFLDAGVRYGLVVGVAMIVGFIAAAIGAFLSRRQAGGLALAMLTTLFVCGMTERLISPVYLDCAFALLLLALLLAVPNEPREESIG